MAGASNRQEGKTCHCKKVSSGKHNEPRVIAHCPFEVRRLERRQAEVTTMACYALQQLRPCRPSGNPTHTGPADGTSPPPTRYTPSILNPLHSWAHDSFSATAPHDPRPARPHCWSARHHRRTRTKTSTLPHAAVRGTSPPS